MTALRPGPTAGLRHVAIFVNKLTECLEFYTELLGMKIEWQPDAENIYLCSGSDNLALHKLTTQGDFAAPQRLDHIGFILHTPEEVDQWYEFLKTHDVKMRTKPRTHRDGARSFYCEDPDGTCVQMIYLNLPSR